jgi:hypothetical protein
MDSKKTVGAIAGVAAIAAVGGLSYVYLTRPMISTNAGSYTVGGTITWYAKNMNPAHSYIVGAVINGVLIYVGSRDERTGVSSSTGTYDVESNIVGSTQFVLYDVTTGKVAASAPIIIT